MKIKSHYWSLFPLIVLLITACSSQDPSGGPVNPQENPSITTSSDLDLLESDPAEEPNHQVELCEDPFAGTTPAFRTAGWKTNFCEHSVDFEEIFSGGPPRDGIPPLDSPRFESVSSAEGWIEDQEPVILFDFEGVARAYPLQILTWHEIVNDETNGTPVAVTFCPLCNTALVFRRPVVNGEILSFGTSGNLRFSDLVMWDRQTESWWQQFNGEAIVGDLTGTRLELLPSSIISWADFKANHPDGEVLSIDTGHSRSYGRNPYSGYDNINSYPFAFTGDLDSQLPPMARVLGIQLADGDGGAFSLELLMAEMVLNETIGGTSLAIFWKPGTASALDSSSIAAGRDVGSTGVFLNAVGDQALTFLPAEAGVFRDQETGSSWNILGEAIDGPLAGAQLVALPHHDTFWFAWAAFVPDLGLSK